MKRRMSAALRVALENVARPIAFQYVRLVADRSANRRSAQSMTQLVQEILRRGCAVKAPPSDGLRLGAAEQWVTNVEWILQRIDQELGQGAGYVLVLRLTRSPKTESSSFGRIADDVTKAYRDAGVAVAIGLEDAEGLYRSALQRFVELLQERGIGRELTQAAEVQVRQWTEPRSQHRLIAVGQQLQRFAQRCRRRQVARPRRRASERLHDVSHGAHV